jgi:hypothetical protein
MSGIWPYQDVKMKNSSKRVIIEYLNRLVEDKKLLLSDTHTSIFSLAKGDNYFVINMAKSNSYKTENDIIELANKNIIILCEDNNLKTIKNVLYQVRCNIFHGEKTPGDINDDRIVKNALPLLAYIVQNLIEIHNIN